MKKILKPFGLLIILALLVVAGYFYWQHSQYYPSTDDAYVSANYVNVSAQVDGQVSQVLIKNHQQVKKGQVLFVLDQKPYLLAVQKAASNLRNTIQTVNSEQLAVEAAKANVKSDQAKLELAIKENNRITNLSKRQLASQQQLDEASNTAELAADALSAAKSQLAEAKATFGSLKNNASIAAAKATLANALLQLSYTKVKAPTAGFINSFDMQQGDTVTAYQPLFVLIDNQHWWVDANFKETNLARIRPNQPVDIRLDIYPNHVFNGTVTSIGRASGSSFSILPAENASGNWVKVTQRFPVRIHISNANNTQFPLRIGASATVTVNTNTSSI